MARKAKMNGKKAHGRPAKKAVDKSAKAEMRRVEPSQMPLPGQNKIFEAMATVKGWKEKIETLTGRLRAYLKGLKADGIDPGVIKDLIALERGDPLEARAYFEQLGVGLKATGTPFQLSVFDIAFKSPVDQAKAEGAAQGKAGRAAEPSRWAEGSPEHTAYMEAYSTAQAKLAPGFVEEPMKEVGDRALADLMAK